MYDSKEEVQLNIYLKAKVQTNYHVMLE